MTDIIETRRGGKAEGLDEAVYFAAVLITAQRLNEVTGEEPSTIYLHPAAEALTDALEEVGFEVVVDDSQPEETCFELAVSGTGQIVEAVVEDTTQLGLWASSTIPDGDGEATREELAAGIATMFDWYIEKFKTEPTHVRMHQSFEPDAEWFVDETGLTVAYDQVPYPRMLFVGVRQVIASPRPVKSSNIQEIEFHPDDDESGTLFVTFKRKDTPDGIEYYYDGVPTATYEGFLAAPSKGRYFAANIKGKYPTHQLDD